MQQLPALLNAPFIYAYILSEINAIGRQAFFKSQYTYFCDKKEGSDSMVRQNNLLNSLVSCRWRCFWFFIGTLQHCHPNLMYDILFI